MRGAGVPGGVKASIAATVSAEEAAAVRANGHPRRRRPRRAGRAGASKSGGAGGGKAFSGWRSWADCSGAGPPSWADSQSPRQRPVSVTPQPATNAAVTSQDGSFFPASAIDSVLGEKPERLDS